MYHGYDRLSTWWTIVLVMVVQLRQQHYLHSYSRSYYYDDHDDLMTYEQTDMAQDFIE